MVPDQKDKETEAGTSMIQDTHVSVVIPAYNAEDHVADAIRSVYEQSYRPLEVIVVNDASVDHTVEVLDAICEHYDADPDPLLSVRVISLEKNVGPCKALYLGFNQARGNYVCFLAADDMYIARGKIVYQAYLMESTGSDWSYYTTSLKGRTLKTATIKKPAFSWIPGMDSLARRNPYWMFVCLLSRNPINSGTLMLSRACAEEIQWNPFLRADCDGDLLLRLCMAGKKGLAIETQAPQYFYRVHPGQVSNQKELMKTSSSMARIAAMKTVLKGNYPLWMKLLVDRKYRKSVV